MVKKTKLSGTAEVAAPDVSKKPSKEKNVWQVTLPVKQALLEIQKTTGGTQEQVLTAILEVYNQVNSNEYHNEKDIQQIAELTEQVNRLGNPEETKKLTEINRELTQVNSELTQVNSELTSQLTALQLEVNHAGEKLTALDLENEAVKKKASGLSDIKAVFGRLNWLLLKWCVARYQKDTGKEISPEEALRILFEGYLSGKVYVFSKPNRKVIEVFTQRIKQNGNIVNTKEEA